MSAVIANPPPLVIEGTKEELKKIGERIRKNIQTGYHVPFDVSKIYVKRQKKETANMLEFPPLVIEGTEEEIQKVGPRVRKNMQTGYHVPFDVSKIFVKNQKEQREFPPLVIEGTKEEIQKVGPRVRKNMPTGYHVPFDVSKIFVKNQKEQREFPPLVIEGTKEEIQKVGPRVRKNMPTGYHVPFDVSKIFVKNQKEQREFPPLVIEGTKEEIQKVGPRVRKNMPTGYHVPFDVSKIFVGVQENIEEPEKRTSLESEPKFKRVPLPAKFGDEPPALVSSGTSSMTITSSSLSCWEEEVNKPENRHMQTLNEIPAVVDKMGIKHSFADLEIVDDTQPQPRQLSDYVSEYGPLHFNEAF